MEGLQRILKGHAFIALDTEHGAIESEKSRALYQIGLAYLPTMAPDLDIPGQPRLGHFINKHQIQSLTLNVNISEQTRDGLIRYRGGIPNRRPSRCGYERQVDLDDLESAVIEFIQSYSSTKLVLIGFEMPAEWNYLLRNFPKAISYFSFWMDLRDIAKDITAAMGVIPARVSVLQTLGYSWKDIKGSNKHGTADNAANDAVSVLAMANGFLNPENQEKLRFRQKCSQVAQHTYNEDKITFGAAIRSRKGLLPNTINSSMKLARYFFHFMPTSTGLKSAEIAFITFKNESYLNQFIQANNQRPLPTGEILSVVAIIKASAGAKEATEREEKQRLRAIKKAERLGSDMGLNGGYTAILEE
ncbi:hypothetical protein SAMD00023353_1302540 [Rosellinia necatrix]|uniref:Uncharacterized protein n=1 Tax=Rosellinia necatrix TaxID=77044 RepID=A0A1S8A770_ROSNE|nr:hypothetical protein SAMD00023353_1302540 [Rosellinia necatrix]